MMRSTSKLSAAHALPAAGFFALALCGGVFAGEPPVAPVRYPIAPVVATTVERTVIPVPVPSYDHTVQPNDVADYPRYSYGVWKEGAGIAPEKRLDLMPAGYAAPAKEKELLRFFSMSDVHITDVQSPAQNLFWGLDSNGFLASYSPVIPYTTQVLDAAVQTANALHKKHPFDFGIFLGDAVNNDQYNELRWYLDVIDGKVISPNSDPLSTAATPYMQKFKAAGLDRSIPWYQVLGNHDHFYSGVCALEDKFQKAHVGSQIMSFGPRTDPDALHETGFYLGVVDGYTPEGKVIGAGKEADFPTAPKVNPNPDRRGLTKAEWIAEFAKTESLPAGHGVAQNADNPPACYTFEPRADLPLRVIVLDDTQKDNIKGQTGAFGSLDQERYQWLLKQLQKGQDDEKLMVIAAHSPMSVAAIPPTPVVPLWDPSTTIIGEEALLAKLHTFPNLILWISGHRHFNSVTAQPSKDPAHPENGFWEVETSSLRDFPQQFRTFDLALNRDGTISVFVTNVDPAVAPGSPAAISRSYSIAATQIFAMQRAKDSAPYLPTGAYNAELVTPISVSMKSILQKAAVASIE